MEKDELQSLGRKSLKAALIAPVVGALCVYAAWYFTHDVLATAIVVLGFLALTACLGFFAYAALENQDSAPPPDDDDSPS